MKHTTYWMWCRTCGHMQLIDITVLQKCRKCTRTAWTMEQPKELSTHDRKFLSALRIAWE